MGKGISESCLVVFAREPHPGKVKTRLSAQLSQEQCLALYQEFLKDTLALAAQVCCDRRVIAYESGGQDPSYLRKVAPHFEFYQQRGDDLGSRMQDVFRHFLNTSHKVVIMGSDSPDLPENNIIRAFEELDSKDLVLGPTYDGGYYLVGLKEPCPEMFENIPWSTGSVFEATLRKAEQFNKKWAILDYWHDIDVPEDLRRLQGEKYINKSWGVRR